MSPQNQTTKKFLDDARSIRERVTSLEEVFFGNQEKGTEGVIPVLTKSIGKAIDEQKVKVDFMAEWMDALVGIVGVEKVEAAVIDTRNKKALAQAEADKAALADAKSKGAYVNLDKVEDECFVVLTEYKNDTEEPIGGGWFKLHTSQLKPEFRELLKDKAPGYSERREASTFTLVEILKSVPSTATTAPESPTVGA